MRKERVDAVRNREAVLAAAARLLDAADDPEHVSMGDIATAAGVGKGTLFRGFGDRTGLLQALVEQRSDRLRAELVADESPAAPVARATAALDAILRFKRENRALVLALERAGRGSPYQGATYGRWHSHLAGLVAEVHGPADADFLAHALLAAVRSDLIEHLADQPLERVRGGLALLVRRVLSTDGGLAAGGGRA
jgi:AcrR family transcriptional regulator